MKMICFVLLLTSYGLASNQELEVWQQKENSSPTHQSELLQNPSSQRDEVVIEMDEKMSNTPIPPKESSNILLKPFQWAWSYFKKQENPKEKSGESEETA